MDDGRVQLEIRTIMITWRTAIDGAIEAGLGEPWLLANIHNGAIDLLDQLNRQIESGHVALHATVNEARAEIRRVMSERRPPAEP